MRNNEILNFLSEKYDRLSFLPYEEIIKKCKDGKELKGIHEDAIGEASDCLFFMGIKKGTNQETILEYSRKNHEINVLGFHYLHEIRPVKKEV